MASKNGFCCLSGNALKIIAAITMIIDHIGVVFFPRIAIFRIIGRISFPIFAFMIAEGCHYTKNKLRYFLSVFILGTICQAVYFFYGGGKLLGILITFSLSILLTYAMQYMKKALLLKEALIKQILSVLLFIAALFAVYLLNEKLLIDYGFFGCLAPVFAGAFKIPREIQNCAAAQTSDAPCAKLSCNIFEMLNLVSLAACLVILIFTMGKIQVFALLALPFLLLYSGKRGKYKMKCFFYVFYHLHLAALEGIAMLIKLLN